MLVPSIHFYDDLAIIHASCVYDQKTKKAILFGGTGGVGKTSIEMQCCKNNDYDFVSDDITVVDKEGYIHPNLAFPKIYAYNIDGSSIKYKDLFNEKPTLLNKAHWNFTKQLRGKAKVRRRVSPAHFYKGIINHKIKNADYKILSRFSGDISSFKNIPLEKDIAIEATLKIILNEYSSFYQHVRWHEYNSSIGGYAPILKMNTIESNFRSIYGSFFENNNIELLSYPSSIKHSDFLATIDSIAK